VFGLERVARLSPLRDSLIGLLKLAESRVVGAVLVPALRVDLGRHSPWGRLLRARAEVARLLIAEVAHLRKAGTGGRNDILAMLVDARDDNGEALGDDELFEQMFTLLPTGYQTTATSLAWVFHHLLRHPEVQDKLSAERQRAAGDGPITLEHLGALPYLDAVIRESARLTPITTDILRLLKKPARIGGLDLPAGVMVSGSIYLTHHRPELWPDPARFDPERFLDVRPSPHSYFPFGGGERRCIGAALAGHEMKIVLARVLSRVDLRPASARRERPVFQTITIAPSRGVPVVMDRPPRPR
jgi:cytochrome P450